MRLVVFVIIFLILTTLALIILTPSSKKENKQPETLTEPSGTATAHPCVSRHQYDVMVEVCGFLADKAREFALNFSITDVIANNFRQSELDASDIVLQLFLVDGIRCYEGMGLPLSFDRKESFGFVMLMYYILTPEPETEYGNVDKMMRPSPKVTSYVKTLKVFSDQNAHIPGLIMPAILNAVNKDLTKDYLILFKRWASIVASLDSKNKDVFKVGLDGVLAIKDCNPFAEELKVSEERVEENKDPMKEIESMIGLSTVKDDIRDLYNYIHIQKMRERQGMTPVGISYHCLFTGNPGTGKTTVARLVAQIYHELGILKKGHLVETDRSGLVAEYMGQTAVKTNKIIDQALDGVLFIDEAYTLAEGGNGDYGKEAIATLLKRMEDDRNRLVVILAGYSENMSRFIMTNPGLKSRFSRCIQFPDYTASELKAIFVSFVNKGQYVMTDEAMEKVARQCAAVIRKQDRNFGNARFVRNLFEKTIQHQANRLTSMGDNIDKKQLSLITENDVPIS